MPTPCPKALHTLQCRFVESNIGLPVYELQKIRDRQLAAPGESASLQELVKNELATKKHVATEGLLWLNR